MPEGAVRPEKVDPSVQSEQPMPELIAQAIRKGWAVDEGMKPHLVQELINIITDDEMPAKAKISAFNALRMGDKEQYDRDMEEYRKNDHPNPAVQVNVQVGDVFNDIERDAAKILGEADCNVQANGDAKSLDAHQPIVTGKHVSDLNVY